MTGSCDNRSPRLLGCRYVFSTGLSLYNKQLVGKEHGIFGKGAFPGKRQHSGCWAVASKAIPSLTTPFPRVRSAAVHVKHPVRMPSVAGKARLRDRHSRADKQPTHALVGLLSVR